MEIAVKHCKGRIISILEGGYNDAGSSPRTWYGLSQCAENHIRTLMTGDPAPETEFFRTNPILYRNIKKSVGTYRDIYRLFNLAGQKLDPLNKIGQRKNQSAGIYVGINSRGKQVLVPILKK
jgi:hypothetical protein